MAARVPAKLLGYVRKGEKVVWWARPSSRLTRWPPRWPWTLAFWALFAYCAVLGTFVAAVTWKGATGMGGDAAQLALGYLLAIMAISLGPTGYLVHLVDTVERESRGYILTRDGAGRLTGYAIARSVRLRFEVDRPPVSVSFGDCADIEWGDVSCERLPSGERSVMQVRWEDVGRPAQVVDLVRATVASRTSAG